MPRRRVENPDVQTAPAKRPGPARVWLSPAGFLAVETPFDQETVAQLRALPTNARRWDDCDRVWRVLVEHLAEVRRILAQRFEVVEVHADALESDGRGCGP